MTSTRPSDEARLLERFLHAIFTASCFIHDVAICLSLLPVGSKIANEMVKETKFDDTDVGEIPSNEKLLKSAIPVEIETVFFSTALEWFP